MTAIAARTGQRLVSAPWLPVLVGAVVGAILGWACLVVSPAALALGIAVVLAALAVVWHPGIGALIAMGLVAVLPSSVTSRGLPFGGGQLEAGDLVVVLALVSWAAAVVVRRDSRLAPPGRISALLLLFLVLAIAGLVTAGSMGVTFKAGLTDLRPLLTYLLVFPIVGSVRSRRELELGLVCVLVAATCGSLYTLWRYLHGESSTIAFSGGGDRVTSAPFLYSMAALIWAAVILAFARSGAIRLVVVGMAAVNLAALVVTFQRGAWIALVAGLLTVLVLLARRRRARMLAAVGLLAVVGVVGVVAVNAASVSGSSNVLGAAGARIVSVGEYGSDVSAQHRLAEFRQARQQIEQHPLTGMGIGSTITFWSPLYDPDTGQAGGFVTNTYLHDSYLWIAYKIGLPALAVFLALLVVVAVYGLRSYAGAVEPRSKALLLGALASLAALAVLAVAGPHLSSSLGVPYAAAVIALISLVPRLERRELESVAAGRRAAPD